MLSQLEIPYRFAGVRRYAIADGRRMADRLQLQDKRSGVEVGLDQVGYGVSQLLPVINICVEASEQIICVEEPELHLHPRLQAGLGNLFAHAVLARGNQVIVETHSESILLRIRRLIRSGKLQPDEVAVIYVDNNVDTGASVRRIRLGEQGELLDPWPTGFFDDSLDDVLGGWG
jgi:predicted ATPase